MRSKPAINSKLECTHPFIRKGYYLGLQADMYVCIRCGEQRSASEWEKFETRRAPPRGLLNGAADED